MIQRANDNPLHRVSKVFQVYSWFTHAIPSPHVPSNPQKCSDAFYNVRNYSLTKVEA